MKRFFAVLLTFTLLAGLAVFTPLTVSAEPTVWDGTVATGFASGTGTSADPYIISTGAQLAYFSSQVNGGATTTGVYFKLGADIVLNSGNAADWATTAPANEFSPIGINTSGSNDTEFREYAFKGTFDGNGYTISGLYIIVTPDSPHAAAGTGLFAIISAPAAIKNLAVINSYISAKRAVGVVGLALCDAFTIDSVYSEIIAAGEEHIGGIVGQLSGTSGDMAVIMNCMFNGSLTATTQNAGGILGNGNVRSIIIENCLNSGEVLGTKYACGILGRNDVGSGCIINNCINAGTVTGMSDIYEIGASASKQFVCKDSYFTGINPSNKNAEETIVNSTSVNDITGTDCVITMVSGGWTKRADNIMVPSGVLDLIPEDVAMADTTAPEVTTVAPEITTPPEVTTPQLEVTTTAPTEETPGQSETSAVPEVTTDADMTKAKDGGCGSVIPGFSIIGALLIGGFVLTRKNQDYKQ